MKRKVKLALPLYTGSQPSNKLGPNSARSLAKKNLGRSLLGHCHEEMTTLAGLLPELFALETGGG